MLNIGLDLHKRETQICIVDGSGAIQLERRLPTTRPAFTALLGGGSPARILDDRDRTLHPDPLILHAAVSHVRSRSNMPGRRIPS